MSETAFQSTFLALGYSATSATLAVANKWALGRFPYSGTLTLLQFLFAASAVKVLHICGVVEADVLSLRKVQAFAPAVLMFYVSIAANLRLLSRATVDTFIVARSVTPILTQCGEILLLGGSTPSIEALLALLLIAIGASGYALTNAVALSSEVLFWASAYVLCVASDMLIVKRVVTDVKLTPWGYVYYNNLIALAFYPGWIAMTGEAKRVMEAFSVLLTPRAALAVGISCAIGLGISFFGLNTRRALSATAFTVLGAACKFLSILINVLCWRHHAPLTALPWLCLALLGSIFYQQAQRRVSKKSLLSNAGETSSSPRRGRQRVQKKKRSTAVPPPPLPLQEGPPPEEKHPIVVVKTRY